jgi:hypothetical protein
VIGPDVALRLARDAAVIGAGHQLLAPVLLRSRLLSQLYQAVGRGELADTDAHRQLDCVRGQADAFVTLDQRLPVPSRIW